MAQEVVYTLDIALPNPTPEQRAAVRAVMDSLLIGITRRVNSSLRKPKFTITIPGIAIIHNKRGNGR